MTRSIRVWRTADYIPELAVAVLTVVSIINAMFIWLLTTHWPQRQVLSEVNRLLPEFDVHVVRFPFADESRYDDELEKVVKTSMHVWNNVMPVGGGFIMLDDFNKTMKDKHSLQLPQKINLPPEFERNMETSYGISVFHQLHCLFMIQTSFNTAVSNSSSLEDFGHHRLLHTYHCFDYVRRALMCAADTALEGQSSTSDEAGTLGEGSYHLCRDYEAVKAYALEHRLSDAGAGDFLDDQSD